MYPFLFCVGCGSYPEGVSRPVRRRRTIARRAILPGHCSGSGSDNSIAVPCLYHAGFACGKCVRPERRAAHPAGKSRPYSAGRRASYMRRSNLSRAAAPFLCRVRLLPRRGEPPGSPQANNRPPGRSGPVGIRFSNSNHLSPILRDYRQYISSVPDNPVRSGSRIHNSCAARSNDPACG